MKKRIQWIDNAKAMLVILMVFGHLNASEWFPKLDGIIKWIYTFHLSAFFMLSGIVFNSNKVFKVFIETKIKTLLIPYFWFSLLALVKPMIYLIKDGKTSIFLSSILDVYVMGNGMWFFCALFFVEITFWLFAKLKFNEWILLIASIVIGSGYYCFININLPYKIDIALYAFPFFCVGKMLSVHIRKVEDIGNKVLGLLAFLSAIVSVMCCFIYNINYTISLRLEHVILPWYWILSVSGSITIFCMAILFSRTRFERAKKLLIYIGSNSLVFYCLNDIVLKVIKVIIFVVFSVDLKNANIVVNFVFGVALVIVTLLIIYPINELICHKFKFLIGK